MQQSSGLLHAQDDNLVGCMSMVVEQRNPSFVAESDVSLLFERADSAVRTALGFGPHRFAWSSGQREIWLPDGSPRDGRLSSKTATRRQFRNAASKKGSVHRCASTVVCRQKPASAPFQHPSSRTPPFRTAQPAIDDIPSGTRQMPCRNIQTCAGRPVAVQ